MNQPRIDISFIRKEQIVDAAVCVISQQGLQNFSLSEIEKKARMSRGQLTYYFPAKEDILLAVFDRFLFLMQLDFQVQDKKTGKPSTINSRALTAFAGLLKMFWQGPWRVMGFMLCNIHFFRRFPTGLISGQDSAHFMRNGDPN
jgi:AcrR family transcriptional regulator